MGVSNYLCLKEGKRPTDSIQIGISFHQLYLDISLFTVFFCFTDSTSTVIPFRGFVHQPPANRVLGSFRQALGANKQSNNRLKFRESMHFSVGQSVRLPVCMPYSVSPYVQLVVSTGTAMVRSYQTIREHLFIQ
jgi:hypothetical protein